MLSFIKKTFFPSIILLSALAISISAATISVVGLSKLFAGAALTVIVMMATLEVSKLVVASLLHQYWNKLNFLLKTYLSSAVIVLMIITSMGIYGFLSGAYQQTSNVASIADKRVAIYENQMDSYESSKQFKLTQLSQYQSSITDLNEALGNNTIQYTNKEGQLITTQSSNQRKAVQKQLDLAYDNIQKTTSEVSKLDSTLLALENKVFEIRVESDATNELGPLLYLSSVTGYPMDKIVNILLIIIVSVFDPLAVTLILAANFAFAQAFKKKPKEDEMCREEDLTKEAMVLAEPVWERDDDFPPPNKNLIKAAKSYQEEIEKLEKSIKSTQNMPNISDWGKRKKLNQLHSELEALKKKQ